ncbi:MAG: sigma-70 family RNA polymerase sigma factor [Planctomycetota bacterium]|nr:MAG: sigma-70 family RNA polymerase sigma factor [Planctomycetota bacterium]REJ93943.1 MAG: sigma-70 family RNA polymerase sigma factor [Planctomycetota bacterium]REK28343.1 MAG: sigma-70 family RNA polymerase sigma factor [Planctomycetota bacterium]REK38819.1 MAG: sigma-70 family RNA polymerase sigma factor [Planctomycetota bacterium]
MVEQIPSPDALDRHSAEARSTAWQSFHHRLECDDSVAMRRLFEDYSQRLVRVASQNIHPALLKRFDGEDVVQSVFRTFFRRHGEGRLHVEHSQQLWRLLVTITLCKTRSHARRHTADRRDAKAEEVIASDALLLEREASPEDALALWEEIDVVLEGLPEKTGEILSRRLEGMNKSEIASDLNISRQTVHRLLNLLEERLAERLDRLAAQPE